MSTLTITRGLPAAGKSTWAKDWVSADPSTRARVNRDDLRLMLYNAPYLPWELEEAITKAQRAAVKALLAAGRDVVVDDMHLRPKYVREWARFAAANGADFDVFELPISIEESIERDAARPRSVGEEVIRRLAEKYTRGGHLLALPDDVFDLPVDAQLYEPVPGTPAAVMVDIDGTIALHNGRSPYDLTRCAEDLPNLPVIDAVRHARTCGAIIIYCSGREDVARAGTVAWLERHLDYAPERDLLYMRPAGDRRKDAIVKRELFDQHIRQAFDVRYVLDDRNQVVEMWRGLGLTVLQVAEGDF